MQSIVNSLAVLAFLGVVLLLFGCATLLKMVRDLQAALADSRGAPSTGDRSHLAVPELASGDGRDSFVLVVEGRCPACYDRAGQLARMSEVDSAVRLAALTKDEQCREWFAGAEVEVIVDAALLGRVGVGVTPTLIRYTPDGSEVWRRIVGSDDDLVRLLGQHEKTGRIT